MMINFETIKNVVTNINTLIAFLLGAVVGAFVVFSLIKFLDEKNEKSYDRDKEILIDQITNLTNEKSDSEKRLTNCHNEKNNLVISIQKDYARKEELNRCLQDYAQKSDQNQRINDENIKLSSQLQNKTACLQRQQQLQKQLNDINKEIQSGVPIGFSPRLLSEQERNERKVERAQLVEQLKQINCQ